MVELEFSDFCGKCGHEYGNYAHSRPRRADNRYNDHSFVRVPLNFDEWRKQLARKVSGCLIAKNLSEVNPRLLRRDLEEIREALK